MNSPSLLDGPSHLSLYFGVYPLLLRDHTITAITITAPIAPPSIISISIDIENGISGVVVEVSVVVSDMGSLMRYKYRRQMLQDAVDLLPKNSSLILDKYFIPFFPFRDSSYDAIISVQCLNEIYSIMGCWQLQKS